MSLRNPGECDAACTCSRTGGGFLDCHEVGGFDSRPLEEVGIRGGGGWLFVLSHFLLLPL